ncbi:hypothetical protein JOM56_013398 [Amanita muscaria]
MGCKPQGVKLPEIPWAQDDHKLVWDFITQLEKDVNYKILFGKKDPSENTSGDSRFTVFKRIAEAILPDMFKLDPSTVADRLKGQLERLTKTYKKQLTKLQRTGEGIRHDVQDPAHEELEYYIPADGPNASTPTAAVNLWHTFDFSFVHVLTENNLEQIEKEFKFFPRLHQIFAARPNVTPIVITTGVGPHGMKKLWYQPPDDVNADETPEHTELLHPTCSSPFPSTPTPVHSAQGRAFGVDLTRTVNIPPANRSRAPKPSVVSCEAIEKARLNIQKIPQKRTLIDTMLDIQE